MVDFSKLVGPGDDYGRAPINPALFNLSTLPYDPDAVLRALGDSPGSITMGRAVNKTVQRAPDEPLPTPTPEQQAALAILCRPDRIVKRLSGKAGTGKSTVIRHLELRVPLTICATTARAALNVRGITMDRLFVYNREKDRCRNEDKLELSMNGCADIIVLDEASMLGHKMAAYVQRVCLMYGKTLILVGDWAQAKPVKDDWITKSTLLNNSITVFLTECHRQHDKPFLDALNALSMGAKSHPAYEVFEACKVNREPEGDHYVRLYATNKMTESYNRSRLVELPLTCPSLPVLASATKNTGDWFPNEEDRLIDDARLLHNTSLRLGARVICTKNDYQRGFVNGDLGTLVDVALHRLPCKGNILSVLNNLKPRPEGLPSVLTSTDRKIVCWLSQLPPSVALEPIYAADATLLVQHDRTDTHVEVGSNAREITDTDETVLMAVRGYPLMLGWAMTIHKCIDKAQLVATTSGMKRAGDLITVVPTPDMVPLPSAVPVQGLASATAATHGWVSAGEQAGFEITTRSGYKLRCGERHRLMGPYGEWVHAAKLQVGDSVLMRAGPYAVITNDKVARLPKNRCGLTKLDGDLAYFLGVCVGDSSHTDDKDYRIDIADEHAPMVEWCFDYVTEHSDNAPTRLPPNGFYVHSKAFRQLLLWAGLGYTKARQARIPSKILESPEPIIREFLRGLFDADGGVNALSVHLTSASEALLDDVQQVLLAYYGIRSWRSAVGVSGRLQVLGPAVKLFMNKIGFRLVSKHQAGDVLASKVGRLGLPKSNLGHLPLNQDLIYSIQTGIRAEYGIPYGDDVRIKSPDGSKRWASLLSDALCGVRHLTYDHLRALMTNFPKVWWDHHSLKQVTSLAKANCFVEEVAEIKKIRCEMVDITVPGDHAYIAGGFVNHNCQGASCDHVYVDMKSIMNFPAGSRHGLAYVALSRCRTLAGLKIYGWTADAIECDPEVWRLLAPPPPPPSI